MVDNIESHLSPRDENIISFLEACDYSSLKNVTKVHLKELGDICQWFNSIFRLSLSNCDDSSKDELIYLLLNLKKNIKNALTELSLPKRKYAFECPACNFKLNLTQEQDFWEKMQNHEHFEELLRDLYCSKDPCISAENSNIENKKLNDQKINQLLDKLSLEGISNGLDSSEEEMSSSRPQTMYSSSEHMCTNLTSVNGSQSDLASITSDDENFDINKNRFKFNFTISYDPVVVSSLYPEGLMTRVKKVDRIDDFTIQKSGKKRVVCLLCPCELQVKFSKKAVDDHVIGQRHLRFASNLNNLKYLSKYHEAFLNLETKYQVHQVYFLPDIGSIKCVICRMFMKYSAVPGHIESDLHKKEVIKLFEGGSNYFQLLENQVEFYGMTKETIIKRNVQLAVKEGKQTDGVLTNDLKQEHKIVKSIQIPPGSATLIDLIPNRFKPHQKFLTKQNTFITCTACKKNIAMDLKMVKEHIFSIKHSECVKMPLLTYKYFCEVCNLKFFEEKAWDKHFSEKRHDNLPHPPGEKPIEYECTTCHAVIFCDEKTLVKHLYMNTRGPKPPKIIKVSNDFIQLFRSNEMLEMVAEKLTIEANHVIKYTKATDDCLLDLTCLLSVIYPHCNVYPFGSRVSGLGNEKSDLDVFVDIGGMFSGSRRQDPSAQVDIVQRVSSILRKSRDFRKIVPIATARTPIVKLNHVLTKLDCDLSFKHGLSVENTKFLRYCMEIQPKCQSLILIIKKWSHIHELNENFTTYALAMLVIFFLQRNEHLLSVKRLRELNPGKILLINGWQTVYYSLPRSEIKSHIRPMPEKIKHTLIDFFTFYEKYDVDQLVICPLLGESVRKALFIENRGTKLPAEMETYITSTNDKNGELFRALSPLCVQDPFDLSHNLTKACPSHTVKKFRTLCKLTREYLENLK